MGRKLHFGAKLPIFTKWYALHNMSPYVALLRHRKSLLFTQNLANIRIFACRTYPDMISEVNWFHVPNTDLERH